MYDNNEDIFAGLDIVWSSFDQRVVVGCIDVLIGTHCNVHLQAYLQQDYIARADNEGCKSSYPM